MIQIVLFALLALSVIINMVFVFAGKERVLNLTPLDIFSICTTVVSIGFNIYQWMDRRALRDSIANPLRALFNDIKTKSNNAIFVYGALFTNNNPHTDIKTMQWEYGIFVQSVVSAFQGFQEMLVGVLVTLHPDDRHGDQLARATDFGLTEQEKALRQANFEKQLTQSTEASPVATTVASAVEKISG
jgi:hypothetical protein